jgi:hypothetical protein
MITNIALNVTQSQQQQNTHQHQLDINVVVHLATYCLEAM